ncbi:MAG TPA: glycosyltransferase, partial [Prosthecobacter sp.]
IIALDRFMAARLRLKGVRDEVIHTDPPWSHDDAVRYDEAGRRDFRSKHGLEDKFVVMYSGNHSPCHPLDPLLAAAKELRTEGQYHFLFVGGGSEMAKVKTFRESEGLGNITTLPYQPLGELSASLSAADLHVVVLGAPFVGMVHPCKIYNILALGIPSLSIGPEECHLTDLGQRLPAEAARFANPGEVMDVVDKIREAARMGGGHTIPASRQLAREFGMELLRSRLIGVIEGAAEKR